MQQKKNPGKGKKLSKGTKKMQKTKTLIGFYN